MTGVGGVEYNPPLGSCNSSTTNPQLASAWARAYIAQGHPAGGDTLNLYDNGALGEGELLRALRQAPPGVVAGRGTSGGGPTSNASGDVLITTE